MDLSEVGIGVAAVATVVGRGGGQDWVRGRFLRGSVGEDMVYGNRWLLEGIVKEFGRYWRMKFLGSEEREMRCRVNVEEFGHRKVRDLYPVPRPTQRGWVRTKIPHAQPFCANLLMSLLHGLR